MTAGGFSSEPNQSPQRFSLTPELHLRGTGQLSRIEDWESLVKEAKFQPRTMAALCPTSLRQLQRFFLQHFNMTPREWANQLKFTLARRLISEGWSNKAIAAELGFADGSHFCHEFKKFYGVPPRRFAPMYPCQPSRRETTMSSLNDNDRLRVAP